MYAQPVYKPLFLHMVEVSIPNQIRRFADADRLGLSMDLTMPDPRAYYTERIINILYHTANLPMRHAYPIPQTITNILQDVLRDFQDGLITAEAAAEYLQNRVGLVLMEME